MSASQNNQLPLPRPGDRPITPEPQQHHQQQPLEPAGLTESQPLEPSTEFNENQPAELSNKNGIPDDFYENQPIEPEPPLRPNGGLVLSNERRFKDTLPDFVIDVELAKQENSVSFNMFNLQKLIRLLESNGFYVTVRQGTHSSIFVFVKCSTKRLLQQYYYLSTKDWLYTVSTTAPSEWNSDNSPELTPAETLRLIYSILTSPPSDHGLGITPDLGDWYFVNSIFPLQDQEMNKKWITRWSTKWVIDDEEITWIRNHFGEKYALYFAFLQNYIVWLIIPSVLGVFTYFFLGPYSKFFGVLNLAWGVLFLNFWKRKEESLAYDWGVKNSSILETPRPLFKPESQIIDPITGETKGYAPKWKRALKQLASIPLALGALLMVAVLQIVSLGLEILIASLYHGPFKTFFGFLPTLILVAVIPVAVGVYSTYVKGFNDWENHETEDSYEISYTQKLFSLAFLTSAGNVLMTSYLYLPFGHLLRPHVDYISNLCQSYLSVHFTSPDTFEINGNRLQQQVLYLMGTAQVVKFFVATVLPYVQRKVFTEAQRITSKDVQPIQDDPAEASFLSSVREQASMPQHSVQPEYQEMVLQFSHIMLFGVVWPLAPLAALINNWIEMRGDAVKICVDVKRPIPSRAESIGPWLTDISIITWMSSLTISSFLAMFGDTHNSFSKRSISGLSLVQATPWRILAYIIVFEHGYFIWSFLVSFVLNQLPNENQKKDKQARDYLRKVSLMSDNSPVTLNGDLKRLEHEKFPVHPSEAAWEQSTDVLKQTEDILVTMQNAEAKKTK